MIFFRIVYARRIVRAAVTVGLLLSFACCAATSAVKKDAVAGNEFAVLPAGALAYMRIDVKPSRGLVDDILTRRKLNTKTVKTFFDRTDTAVAAVYPASNESAGEGLRRFLMIAYGKNYPAALSSFSLFFNPDWKKTKSVSGKKYWRYQKNHFSLFMQKNQARISDGDPFFTEDGAETPEIFNAFGADADVSAWITKPDFLNTALARMDIPITVPALALFISASKRGEDWQASFRLETPSQAQARGLVSVLSLARNALAGAYIKDPELASLARLLLSEPPSVDGNALILKSPSIPESVLAGLIVSFSI
ncbi:MAG: hypothetical protein LBB47_07780 [Spirochaetaceae bacterium]|jgi:hypothetical protein|nr:hypothetical protein [Spirochaetaceae bacterium]